MFSFYYVVTYNVQHPTVKKLLDTIGVSAIQNNIMNFQIRSKMYINFDDTCEAVHDDFELKMPAMYGPNHEEQLIRMVNATNPMFNPDCENSSELDDWADDCAGSVFYAEAESDDDVDTAVEPNSWMFKYEIYFIEDITEWPRNGEATYSPPEIDYQSLSSTYH